MIRIRYSDLPPGSHASAKTEGRHTVIYLLPGLSPADRRSAIDRLRASAKFGYGPKLPAVPLVLALIADRVRLNTKNAAAAARLHPTGLAIPVLVLAGGAILYVLLVTVSIRIGLPATSDLALEPLPVATAPASAGTARPAPATHHAADPAGPASASRPTGPPASGAAGQSGGIGPGGRQQHARPSPVPPGTPKPSPQPGIGSSPTVSPSPGSPLPDLWPSPTPSSSRAKPGGGGSGCVELALIHICV